MEKQNIKTKIELHGWRKPSRELVEETKEEEKEERPDRRVPDLVRRALDAFEKRLNDENFKPTLAEYLKLLQFEQEVTQEDEIPREITVTWVEPETDFLEE
ncbi:MAG: hypothetical protein WBY44_36485 [Bryobacteraceae bacterium]|jgi:hypothetical protein